MARIAVIGGHADAGELAQAELDADGEHQQDGGAYIDLYIYSYCFSRTCRFCFA